MLPPYPPTCIRPCSVWALNGEGVIFMPPPHFFIFSPLKNSVPRTLTLIKKGPLRPPQDTTAPRSSRQSCRYLRVPSRIQSGYLAKVPSAAPKTAPAHTSEHPKSAQNLPQTHQSHLSHYTNDASEFPWRVGCKAPKFNPLINLKNLKGEYLYAMTLYQFYPQALGPFFMSFY
jgi:hypothetical protein